MAYKLEVKKWQAIMSEDKLEIENRKKNINFDQRWASVLTNKDLEAAEHGKMEILLAVYSVFSNYKYK